MILRCLTQFANDMDEFHSKNKWMQILIVFFGVDFDFIFDCFRLQFHRLCLHRRCDTILTSWWFHISFSTFSFCKQFCAFAQLNIRKALARILRATTLYANQKKNTSHTMIRMRAHTNPLQFVEFIFIAHKHIPRANYNKTMQYPSMRCECHTQARSIFAILRHIVTFL